MRLGTTGRSGNWQAAKAKIEPPRPVQLGSLKSENEGQDPGIRLVPSGGGGWGRKKTEDDEEEERLREEEERLKEEDRLRKPKLANLTSQTAVFRPNAWARPAPWAQHGASGSRRQQEEFPSLGVDAAPRQEGATPKRLMWADEEDFDLRSSRPSNISTASSLRPAPTMTTRSMGSPIGAPPPRMMPPTVHENEFERPVAFESDRADSDAERDDKEELRRRTKQRQAERQLEEEEKSRAQFLRAQDKLQQLEARARQREKQEEEEKQRYLQALREGRDPHEVLRQQQLSALNGVEARKTKEGNADADRSSGFIPLGPSATVAEAIASAAAAVSTSWDGEQAPQDSNVHGHQDESHQEEAFSNRPELPQAPPPPPPMPPASQATAPIPDPSMRYRPTLRPPPTVHGPPAERPPPPSRQVPSPSMIASEPEEAGWETLKPPPPSVTGHSVWGESHAPMDAAVSPLLNGNFPGLADAGPQSKKERQKAVFANQVAETKQYTAKPPEAWWGQAQRSTGTYSLQALAKPASKKGKRGKNEASTLEGDEQQVYVIDAQAESPQTEPVIQSMKPRVRKERGVRRERNDSDAEEYRRHRQDDSQGRPDEVSGHQDEAPHRNRRNRRDRDRAEREEYRSQKRDDGSRRDREGSKKDLTGFRVDVISEGPMAGGRARRNLRTAASDSEDDNDDEEEKHTLRIDPQKPPRILQKPPVEKLQPREDVQDIEQRLATQSQAAIAVKGRGKATDPHSGKGGCSCKGGKAAGKASAKGGKQQKGKSKARGRRIGDDDSDEEWPEASASEEEAQDEKGEDVDRDEFTEEPQSHNGGKVEGRNKHSPVVVTSEEETPDSDADEVVRPSRRKARNRRQRDVAEAWSQGAAKGGRGKGRGSARSHDYEQEVDGVEEEDASEQEKEDEEEEKHSRNRQMAKWRVRESRAEARAEADRQRQLMRQQAASGKAVQKTVHSSDEDEGEVSHGRGEDESKDDSQKADADASDEEDGEEVQKQQEGSSRVPHANLVSQEDMDRLNPVGDTGLTLGAGMVSVRGEEEDLDSDELMDFETVKNKTQQKAEKQEQRRIQEEEGRRRAIRREAQRQRELRAKEREEAQKAKAEAEAAAANEAVEQEGPKHESIKLSELRRSVHEQASREDAQEKDWQEAEREWRENGQVELDGPLVRPPLSPKQSWAPQLPPPSASSSGSFGSPTLGFSGRVHETPSFGGFPVGIGMVSAQAATPSKEISKIWERADASRQEMSSPSEALPCMPDYGMHPHGPPPPYKPKNVARLAARALRAACATVGPISASHIPATSSGAGTMSYDGAWVGQVKVPESRPRSWRHKGDTWAEVDDWTEEWVGGDAWTGGDEWAGRHDWTQDDWASSQWWGEANEGVEKPATKNARRGGRKAKVEDADAGKGSGKAAAAAAARRRIAELAAATAEAEWSAEAEWWEWEWESELPAKKGKAPGKGKSKNSEVHKDSTKGGSRWTRAGKDRGKGDDSNDEDEEEEARPPLRQRRGAEAGSKTKGKGGGEKHWRSRKGKASAK